MTDLMTRRRFFQALAASAVAAAVPLPVGFPREFPMRYLTDTDMWYIYGGPGEKLALAMQWTRIKFAARVFSNARLAA